MISRVIKVEVRVNNCIIRHERKQMEVMFFASSLTRGNTKLANLTPVTLSVLDMIIV